MTFALIATVARDGAIGVTRDGQPGLPWDPHLYHDTAWFRILTTARDPYHCAEVLCAVPISFTRLVDAPLAENAVIMGSRTFESLPLFPLGMRHNVVISQRRRNAFEKHRSLSYVADFEQALRYASSLASLNIFVIGGAQVYAEALKHPGMDTLYLTEVDAEYPEAETEFPVDTFDLEKGRLWVDTRERLDTMTAWDRKVTSPWVQEANQPRYRFGIWEVCTW